MTAPINRRRAWVTTAWTTATAIVLLAPLIAMQFTSEVNWTVADFVFVGGLLLGNRLSRRQAPKPLHLQEKSRNQRERSDVARTDERENPVTDEVLETGCHAGSTGGQY